MQGVADDLSEGAIVGEYDVGHAGEILVEERPEDFWF